MMKTDQPLSPFVHWLVVASGKGREADRAGYSKTSKHAYITKRYAVAAFVARFLPRPMNSRLMPTPEE
jgi:hypothetical protein